MSSADQPPAGVSASEWRAHVAREQRRAETRGGPKRPDAIEMTDLVAKLAALPPETAEEKAAREKAAAGFFRGERVAAFQRICPEEFHSRVDRAKLVNSAAFDAVAKWDGSFPGPLAFGPTGRSKTRAAWSALARLLIDGGRSLSWFPVKRLVTELGRYEAKDIADEFWRMQGRFDLLLVDDLDKVNWQFESELAAVFQFYDWVYREHRPCVTTTNKDRRWWADKMGDAFARRLFDDAHRAVAF